MECSRHLRRKAVGYCAVCGEIGCDNCLTQHEGVYYCRHHYTPIAEKIARHEKRKSSLLRRNRQRLVVHTREGKIAYGTSVAVNPHGNWFQLDLVDRHGQPLSKNTQVHFEHLKAVFYVKSFDGRVLKEAEVETNPSGIPIIVEFFDDEIIPGYTMHPYREDEPRFRLIPQDPKSNNITVLVETAALLGAYTPEEYKEKHKRELHDYIEHHRDTGFPQEEILGDYYFEKRDYERAMKHYRLAQREAPSPSSLRHKVVATEYNIGVRCIRRHEYEQALKCMKWVLSTDPEHERAMKKIKQLSKHIDRKTRPSGSGSES